MKSFDLGTHDITDTINMVASYITQLSDLNSIQENSGYTTFHARSVPNIDITSYLIRIQRYCPTSNESYLAMIIYLHRIIKLNMENKFSYNFTVDAYSIHRLIITSIMVSSKYYSDVFFTNSRYAKVGGISVMELNHLELELLISLNFDITITLEELQYYGDQLINSNLSYLPPQQLFEGPRFTMPPMPLPNLELSSDTLSAESTPSSHAEVAALDANMYESTLQSDNYNKMENNNRYSSCQSETQIEMERNTKFQGQGV
ncbi:cyclin-domain-containing protein [Neoconidiobolus thromboides FSU 785]|nr:cyclin-domain-containing protein [Neoconidiobolus thromboides FSU 785]